MAETQSHLVPPPPAPLVATGTREPIRHVVTVYPRRPEPPAIALMAIFAAVGGAFIASGRVPSRVFYDQELYHRPTINQFVRQWPDFDFWHYLSATTPGYHLLMAEISRIVSPTVLTLQCASMAISLLLVGLLGYGAGRRVSGWLAVAFCMPFLMSPYVIGSGAWLLPDNLAWLGVLCILVVALQDHWKRVRVGWLLAGGAVLLALVFVRQIHVWTAGLLWASAWIRPATVLNPRDPQKEPRLAAALFWDAKAQAARVSFSVLATMPAIALIVLFIRYWGGPVPPVFQQWFHSYNPSAGAFVLALFGVWGVFFSATWLPYLMQFYREARGWLLGAVVAALLYALAVPTNPDFDALRHTGLWSLADRFPVFGHTSPFMVGLAVLGAMVIAALSYGVPIRQRLVFLAAIAGFVIANSANNDLFQRYVDPFVLMILAFMASTCEGRPEITRRGDLQTGTDDVIRHPAPANQGIQLIGPLILSLTLLGITVRSVTRSADGKPDWAHITDPPPPARTESKNDTREVPCEMPRPPMPPGKRFWPWAL